MKFKLNELDNFKIIKAIKKSNIYILHLSSFLEETHTNNLERIAGK